MDQLRQSIRQLRNMIVPGITLREETEIRSEIMMLEEEYQKLQHISDEKSRGISQYGSYFAS